MPDPHYYTGDDDREFGPDPQEDDCVECGAGPLEDCAWWCACAHCVNGRAKAKATGPEAA